MDCAPELCEDRAKTVARVSFQATEMPMVSHWPEPQTDGQKTGWDVLAGAKRLLE